MSEDVEVVAMMQVAEVEAGRDAVLLSVAELVAPVAVKLPGRLDFARATARRAELFSRLRTPDSTRGLKKKEQG